MDAALMVWAVGPPSALFVALRCTLARACRGRMATVLKVRKPGIRRESAIEFLHASLWDAPNTRRACGAKSRSGQALHVARSPV